MADDLNTILIFYFTSSIENKKQIEWKWERVSSHKGDNHHGNSTWLHLVNAFFSFFCSLLRRKHMFQFEPKNVETWQQQKSRIDTRTNIFWEAKRCYLSSQILHLCMRIVIYCIWDNNYCKENLLHIIIDECPDTCTMYMYAIYGRGKTQRHNLLHYKVTFSYGIHV